MKETIIAKLEQIERDHSVTILFAAESGSRAWGFASTDSDYDVRFIYVQPERKYLSLIPAGMVLDKANGLSPDLCTDLLDFSGWDIFKALSLFRKSNPPMIEWLKSPIIYKQVGSFAARLRDLAWTDLSMPRFAYHHLSLAGGNWKSYFEGKDVVSHKKYLYVLRSIFCAMWVLKHDTPPPTSMEVTLKGIEIPTVVDHALALLLEKKKSGIELDTGTPDPILHGWIAEMLLKLSAQVREIPEEDWVDAEKLDHILHDEIQAKECGIYG